MDDNLPEGWGEPSYEAPKLPAREEFEGNWPAPDEPIPRVGMVRDLSPKTETRYTERWEIRFDATVLAGLEGGRGDITAEAILVRRMTELLTSAGVMSPNVRARKIGRGAVRGPWEEFEEYQSGEYVTEEQSDGTHFYRATLTSIRRRPSKNIQGRGPMPGYVYWEEVSEPDMPPADPLFADAMDAEAVETKELGSGR